MIIIRIFICMIAALLFSVNDFAWPACEHLYDVVDTEADQDGNTVFYIFVNKWTQENGTDSVCLNFGRCVYDLIGTAPGMAAVSIINPGDDWVPSMWRWIDSTRAAVLAEELDFEDYAMLSTHAWERTDYDD